MTPLLFLAALLGGGVTPNAAALAACASAEQARPLPRIVYNGPVRAPVQAGQPVGVVKVWRGANIAVEAPVYAAEAVDTGSTMRRAIDGASELVIGMFRASAEKL